MQKIFKIFFLSSMLIAFCFTTVHAEGQYIQLPKNEVDRQTFINNVTDFFSTIGQSKKDKEDTVKERKAIRREDRLRNQMRQKKNETKKQMKQQQEDIMKKINAVNQARHSNKK